MKRFNCGYEIIASETYNVRSNDKQESVVLGKHDTLSGAMYVTWECTVHPAEGDYQYFWGHYFVTEEAARADYHNRLLHHYEIRSNWA